jgi:hypothetical protein
MPTSNLYVAPFALEHSEALKPSTIMEIGPGYGKYARLHFEYLSTHPVSDCIEAWEPYIEEFGLRGIYRNVYIADVLAVDPDLLNSCDMVFGGDVIEHLIKEDGLALLDRITVPSVWVTPLGFFHNPHGLPWTETHRSHWTREDFENTGRVKRYEESFTAHVVTLLGR